MALSLASPPHTILPTEQLHHYLETILMPHSTGGVSIPILLPPPPYHLLTSPQLTPLLPVVDIPTIQATLLQLFPPPLSQEGGISLFHSIPMVSFSLDMMKTQKEKARMCWLTWLNIQL